jgi:hypothetical protein
MKLRIYDPRILAIDLRHRRFGYAAFEGHKTLLDWGLRFYPAIGEAEAALLSKRLAELLKMFSPEAIVVTRERWDRAETNSHMRILREAILSTSAAHSVAVRALEQNQVRQSFQPMGCETRYEIAAALTRIFPELLSDLPPARLAWQSEHGRMPIFDAVGLGLAYWHHEITYVYEPDG